MKTTMRLLIFVAVFLSANVFAQNSTNDLFNTYVIAPAQQRIQILTDELNSVNVQIQDLQDQINSATASQGPDASSDPDVPATASPLTAQVAELQARAAELQNTLTFWQTQLTAWLAFNTQQQEQYLTAHSHEIVVDTGEDVINLISNNQNPLDRMGPMPDANNPWVVPVFVSTGDTQQDELLIQQWLFQHGLIDSIDGQ